MDKAFKIVSIIAILIVAFSVFYYLVIFIPQKERARELKLEDCLNRAEKLYSPEEVDELLEICNKSTDPYRCGLSLEEEIKEGRKEAKDECFKKYPQK